MEIYYHIESFSEGLELCEKIIEQWPYDPYYYYKKAEFLFRLSRFEEALINTEKVLSI